MKSLVELSSEQIISSLPQECLNRLIEKYIKERVYDLDTFVETKEPPEKGWFVVFRTYPFNNTHSIYLDITSHVPGLCTPYLDMLFRAYWIPDSGLNEVIYFKEEPTPKSKVYLSLRRNKEIKTIWYYKFSFLDKQSSVNRLTWMIGGSPTNFNITYYVPN